MELFDMEKAHEQYGHYVDECEMTNEEPMDFDSWFDIILTDV